jgi:hypothetical protein
MVPATNDWENPGSDNVGHSPSNLIECLFDVAGDCVDVPDITEIKFFMEVHRGTHRVAVVVG